MIIYYTKTQSRVEEPWKCVNTVRVMMRIWYNELSQTGIYVGFMHRTTSFCCRCSVR